MAGKRKMSYSEKRNTSSVVPVFLMFIIAAAAALIIALIWQRSEEKAISGSSSDSSAESSFSQDSVPESGSQESSTEDSSLEQSSSEETSSEGSSSEESEQSSSAESSSKESSAPVIVNPDPIEIPWAVPQSDPVDSSYFSDAIFIGDSITTGISIYDVMNTNVVAHKGINIQTVLTKEVIETPDGMKTIAQASKLYPDQKIYIMLGSNGIAWIAKNQFIGFYGQFIDQIRDAHPDSTIYIQSILPVTKWKSENGPEYANSKIDEYNLAIAQLAREKGCHFLNVAQAFKDQYGNLPDEASPADGMHFIAKYYIKWFDYLKVHTVS